MKYNHWFPKLIKVNAIVINKIIYFAMDKSYVTDSLLRHEKEHVKQQEEEGFLLYFKYIWEYFKNLVKYRSHYKAYYNISYEVEARKAEEV